MDMDYILSSLGLTEDDDLFDLDELTPEPDALLPAETDLDFPLPPALGLEHLLNEDSLGSQGTDFCQMILNTTNGEDSAEGSATVTNAEAKADILMPINTSLDPDQSVDDINGVGLMEGSIPLTGRSNGRRKASLASRNVEEGDSDGAPKHSSMVVDLKPNFDEPAEEIQKRPKKTTGPPKMHQLDPRVHPKAKGAVYSRMNREKKKNELHDTQMALSKANREIQFLKSRIAFRDGLLHQHVGDEGMKSIHFVDNQNQYQ